MDRSDLTLEGLSRSRRRLVQGLAGGVLVLGSARRFGWVAAAEPATAGDAGAVLSGTEFNLEIGALAVNFTGQPGIATAERTTPCAAVAVARRGCHHTASVESVGRTELHPLARSHSPRRYGRRAGTELRRHRAGRDLRLSLQSQ